MLSPRIFSVIAIAVFLTTGTGDSSKDCVYTLYIQTGWGITAGTNSKISATLGDSMGRSVWAPDLEDWGLMGWDHDYFERANLDIFAGRGPCFRGPLCRLNLTSDGSGAHHGWFCEYVEVTSTGPHTECSQTLFYVNQWLVSNAPPYEMTAVIDGCKGKGGPPRHGNTGPLVVGKPIGSAPE
ncbi:PLAT domain-containing protein [Actinidia chinensis var. chinensis]|uniref:PLAT domain-containing protein n=1 Tax=Actinidia chinensis var. chinensis TaxID=1590841 RepID=A0A2R6PLW1_ACTCC|nr:PLAT domain-containing protein [Actinidia chinensis var. chinensis]